MILTERNDHLDRFDFARPLSPEPDRVQAATTSLSMLPTTPRTLTAEGTILGTFQSMAPEQLEGVVLVGVLGEHDDADAGVGLADGVGGGDALGVVARRHPDVGDDDVGAQACDGVEEFGGRADGGEDVGLAGVLEEAAGALAHQVVVLGDDDAQRALGAGRGRGFRHGCPP